MTRVAELVRRYQVIGKRGGEKVYRAGSSPATCPAFVRITQKVKKGCLRLLVFFTK